MLRILLIAVVLLAFAGAIVALVDALERAGRAAVRLVLASCIAGFSIATGALVSLAVDQHLGTAILLGLQTGRWAGIATTCFLLALAAYRYSRDDVSVREVQLAGDGPGVERAQQLKLPSTKRHAGPWWSPATWWARKEDREDSARLKAWETLADQAGWAAARIAVARNSCEGFLRGPPGECGHSATELGVAIRRRVPEIIFEAIDECRGATPSEERALMNEAVELLELLAAEAERRRVASNGAASRLATKRAYVEEMIRRGSPG